MGYMSDRKWVHNKEEFPKDEHFVIIEFGYRHVDAGYGDGGNDEPHLDYIVYVDESAWKAEIIKRTTDKSDRGNWVALKAGKPVSTKVSVEVVP